MVGTVREVTGAECQASGLQRRHLVPCRRVQGIELGSLNARLLVLEQRLSGSGSTGLKNSLGIIERQAKASCACKASRRKESEDERDEDTKIRSGDSWCVAVPQYW